MKNIKVYVKVLPKSLRNCFNESVVNDKVSKSAQQRRIRANITAE